MWSSRKALWWQSSLDHGALCDGPLVEARVDAQDGVVGGDAKLRRRREQGREGVCSVDACSQPCSQPPVSHARCPSTALLRARTHASLACLPCLQPASRRTLPAMVHRSSTAPALCWRQYSVTGGVSSTSWQVGLYCDAGTAGGGGGGAGGTGPGQPPAKLLADSMGGRPAVQPLSRGPQGRAAPRRQHSSAAARPSVSHQNTRKRARSAAALGLLRLAGVFHPVDQLAHRHKPHVLLLGGIVHEPDRGSGVVLQARQAAGVAAGEEGAAR